MRVDREEQREEHSCQRKQHSDVPEVTGSWKEARVTGAQSEGKRGRAEVREREAGLGAAQGTPARSRLECTRLLVPRTPSGSSWELSI